MRLVSTIYHYCSPEVFDLVMRTKTMRMSDLDKTNDYMEKEWGAHLIEEVLSDELKKHGIKIDLREQYWYPNECQNHIDYLKKNFLYYRKKQSLIACFSYEGDDLGQWRGYGQDGHGLAIGFDYRKMSRLMNVSGKVEMKEVIYKREKQMKELANYAIEPAIDYMQALFENYILRNTDDYNEFFVEEFDTFTEVVVESLAKVVSCIKNPAFEAEKEVRIIHHTNIGNYEDDDEEILETFQKQTVIGAKNQFALSPVNFQFRNNKLVSYADLSFSNMIDKGIITEIVIGPKSDIKEKDLFYYLIANGYGRNVKVRKSNASYR